VNNNLHIFQQNSDIVFKFAVLSFLNVNYLVAVESRGGSGLNFTGSGRAQALYLGLSFLDLKKSLNKLGFSHARVQALQKNRKSLAYVCTSPTHL
jgi:hypothetical protein